MGKLLEQKTFLVIIAFTALASLSFAYIAQFFFHVVPCQLCFYERYFYWGIALIAVIGLIKPELENGIFKICALVLIAGTALGIYHLGVEMHWWQGPSSCSGITQKPQSIEEFRQLLKEKPIVRCDQVNWVILGVSATLWNLLWFSGFLVIWGMYWHKGRR